MQPMSKCSNVEGKNIVYWAKKFNHMLKQFIKNSKAKQIKKFNMKRISNKSISKQAEMNNNSYKGKCTSALNVEALNKF